jgi:hypothetical protein
MYFNVIVQYLENGLTFRGGKEMFDSPHNRNFLGLKELTVMFEPFLANHLKHYGSSGCGEGSGKYN